MVSAIFAQPGRQIRISGLGFLEIQSAFAMKVRSAVLERKAAGMQRARLLLDVAAGDIEVYGVIVDHFVTAERLIGRHSFAYRLRTLDALQLAVCTRPLAPRGWWTTLSWPINRLAKWRLSRA